MFRQAHNKVKLTNAKLDAKTDELNSQKIVNASLSKTLKERER